MATTVAQTKGSALIGVCLVTLVVKFLDRVKEGPIGLESLILTRPHGERKQVKHY